MIASSLDTWLSSLDTWTPTIPVAHRHPGSLPYREPRHLVGGGAINPLFEPGTEDSAIGSTARRSFPELALPPESPLKVDRAYWLRSTQGTFGPA